MFHNLLKFSLIFTVACSFKSNENISFTIQKSLEVQNASSTLAEWEGSPYGLISIQKQIETLNNDEKTEACENFKALDNKNLSTFDQIIGSHFLDPSCTQDLLARLDHYYGEQKTALQQNLALNHLIKDPSLQLSSVGQPQETLDGGFVFVNKEEMVETSSLNLPRGEIILTFDDGPHPTRTTAIQNLLTQYHVRSNFFAIGASILNVPHSYDIILNAVNNLGMIYGSHSMGHGKPLNAVSFATAQQEIDHGHDLMVAAAQADSGFFRFPYGARNQNLKNYLSQEKRVSFLWNMDSLDWKIKDSTKLYQNVMNEINREKRGILLFHDIHQQTVDILEPLLEELHRAGYKIKLAVPLEWKDSYH